MKSLFLGFIVSVLLPVGAFAQPLTPEEERELEELEELEPFDLEERALREAMRDTPVESMNAPAWCFQYRSGRDECFNNVKIASAMLAVARLQNEAEREDQVEVAELFAEAFEELRARGPREWCERLRQTAFDYGNTRQLSCRQANEVFVVTAQWGREGETEIQHVSSDFRQAWGVLQEMTACNGRSEYSCQHSNIRIRKLVYTPPLTRITL